MTRKIKSELHHWWPQGVSSYWADAEGGVHWITPDGDVRKSVPRNFGAIGNGHHVKLGKEQDEVPPWDFSFEKEFDKADSQFHSLIEWLSNLERASAGAETPLPARFKSVDVTEAEVVRLLECVVSLIVRTPMHRERAVRWAEDLRGPIPQKERNNLIGLNICHSYRDALKWLKTAGKFAIIFSDRREFVYGDGFFSNFPIPVQYLSGTKFFVPITPSIAVLYAYPSRYMTNPRMVTLAVTEEEVNQLNSSVQIYSKEAIFYRNHKPELIEPYRCGKHLRYSDWNNPVDRLIELIPGIPPRDTSLDFLFQRNERP